MLVLFLVGSLSSLLIVSITCEIRTSTVAKQELFTKELSLAGGQLPTVDLQERPKAELELFKEELRDGTCWGYEPDCDKKTRYSSPICDGSSLGWTHSKREQVETFFKQGDFGYVGGKRDSLKTYCSPRRNPTRSFSPLLDSWLECSDHMHFCRGNGIRLDLTHLLQRRENLLYKMDVLSTGQIGADCALDLSRLTKNSDEISPLQSWGPEMRNFVEMNSSLADDCDIRLNKIVYVMKLDAEVNMYHHFCDFFNLFASLHVSNDGKFGVDPFGVDVQVILWQSIPYRSNFGLAWKAFTNTNPLTLSDLAGKKVCFKGGVMFPLLPRMIFGLYYNTPIIPGCRNSGLFRAFNRFITGRMVPEVSRELAKRDIGVVEGPENPVRVTFLSRLTKHRRISNQADLLAALHKIPGVALTKAEFSFGVPFKTQVETIQSTDVLVGIHGSGLTHLLFLPDWAAVFEVYNCGDADCYYDLARLRGVGYHTWPQDSASSGVKKAESVDVGHHEKFANYTFDVSEFKRLVTRIVESVRNDPLFPKLRPETRARGKKVKSEL